jgi:hypothetical protein
MENVLPLLSGDNQGGCGVVHKVWIKKLNHIPTLVEILGSVIKIQLHATHVITNSCSCLKTSCMWHSITCNTMYATCIYNVNIHVHPHIPIQMYCTLYATFFATTMQLIKIRHMLKNWIQLVCKHVSF